MQLSNHSQILALDERRVFNSSTQFTAEGQLCMDWAGLGVGLSDCLPELVKQTRNRLPMTMAAVREGKQNQHKLISALSYGQQVTWPNPSSDTWRTFLLTTVGHWEIRNVRPVSDLGFGHMLWPLPTWWWLGNPWISWPGRRIFLRIQPLDRITNCFGWKILVGVAISVTYP